MRVAGSLRWRASLTGLLLAPLLLFATSNGSPYGRTGAFGEPGCDGAGCHRPEPLGPGSGRITIAVAPYVPGQRQRVVVTVFDIQARRWGFQLAAREKDNPQKQAGSFSLLPDYMFVVVHCASGSLPPCKNELEYATHTSVGAYRGNFPSGSATFELDWTPPPGNVGDVILTAAGLGADGDLGTNGDHAYAATTISPSGVPAPRPVIVLSSSQLDFSANLGGPAPPPQTVNILNGGSGALSWTATANAAWLQVSPAAGTAPSLLSISAIPASLALGTSTGLVTVAAPGIPSETIAVILRVIGPTAAINGIVNAASFRTGMVPGGLATLFGRNVWPANSIEFPGGAVSYKGVTVTVQGRPVPLVGVANANGLEQISFQVPFDLTAPGAVQVQVNSNGLIAAADNVPLLRAQPGIFEYQPPGSNLLYAAMIKMDGSLVGPNNPVSREEAAAIFLTGMGGTLPIIQTGQLAPTDPLARTYLQPTVGIAGRGARVLFSGLAPGFLGLYQINIVIPDSAPPGEAVNLDIVVDGAPSQTSRIAVR